MYTLIKSIRNEAQFSCLPLYSVVLSTRRVSCTRLYVIVKVYEVSTYATAIHCTQRQITTRTTLHYNIEYQCPFRYHINIASPTERCLTLNCQIHMLSGSAALNVGLQQLSRDSQVTVMMVDTNNFKNEICRSLLLIPHAIYKSEIH